VKGAISVVGEKLQKKAYAKANQKIGAYEQKNLIRAVPIFKVSANGYIGQARQGGKNKKIGENQK
jgi:hypothetical protein